MFQKSLYHELRNNALKFENKTAISFGEHPITYKRLLDAIDRLASALSRLGVSTGDPFAILLPNIPQFIISFFAVNKLGATIIPVDSGAPHSTIEQILLSCKIKGLIALDRLFEPLQDPLREVYPNLIVISLGETVFPNAQNLTRLIAASEPGNPSVASSSVECPPAIFHTSGTTGPAKAVAVSQQNLGYRLEAARRALALDGKESLFCLLSLANSRANVAAMLAPLLFGCKLVLFNKFELNEVSAAFQLHDDVVLVASNAILEEMIQRVAEFPSPPKLRASVCLSQMSATRRFEFQEKFGAPVVQGYGLTEAGPFVSVYDPRYNQKNESAGFPSFGFQIKIVDSQDQNVDINTVGEIMIHGAAVASDHFAGGEISSHRPTPLSWFRTGDLGKFDDQGHLYVVGRKRDLIIKGGFEVYPDEVRALLAQHSKVSECRVFGVHDDILGQEIKALIVPMNGNHLSKEELSAYCRQHLAMYKCPKYIEIVNSLTEKTSGVAPPAAPTASDAPSVLDNSSVIS